MIEEAYVSFETAKLLKEKGFDETTFTWYTGKGKFCVGKNNFDDYHMNHFSSMATSKDKNKCSAPTLQMAMAWLREVHNILIIIDVRSGIEQESIYCWQLEDKHTGDYIGDIIGECSLYEEAVDSAIKYCLENLI